MLETPALEILIALVGIQLAVLIYLHYRHVHDEPAAAAAEEPEGEPVDPPNETDAAVECGDCGAENDPSYRYCRRCVTDLSGESIPGHRERSPSGRLF